MIRCNLVDKWYVEITKLLDSVSAACQILVAMADNIFWEICVQVLLNIKRNEDVFLFL